MSSFYINLLESLLKQFLCKDLALLVLDYVPNFPFWSVVKKMERLHKEDEITYQDVPLLFRVIEFTGDSLIAAPFTMFWDQSPTVPFPETTMSTPYPDAFIWTGSPLEHERVYLNEEFCEPLPEAELYRTYGVYAAETHCCHYCGEEKAYHSEDPKCNCTLVKTNNYGQIHDRDLYRYFFLVFISRVFLLYDRFCDCPRYTDEEAPRAGVATALHHLHQEGEFAHFCSDVCVTQWKVFMGEVAELKNKSLQSIVEQKNRDTRHLLSVNRAIKLVTRSAQTERIPALQMQTAIITTKKRKR